MLASFPPDLEQFVQTELASGKYNSEEELVLAAVRLLHQRELHLRQFRDNLKKRLDRLDRGEGIQLEDDETLGAFFDEIENEVNQDACDVLKATKGHLDAKPIGLQPPEIIDPTERAELIQQMVERMKQNPLPSGTKPFTREELHEHR